MSCELTILRGTCSGFVKDRASENVALVEANNGVLRCRLHQEIRRGIAMKGPQFVAAQGGD